MWTSQNFEAFLGITIYYVDKNWKMRQFLLDIILFTSKHTGVNMADAINELIFEFNIQDKVLALMTDNESAMIVCGRLIAQELQNEFDNIGFSHYCYVAHILNL